MTSPTFRRLGDVIEVKHGFAFDGAYFCDSGPYRLLTPGNFAEAGGFVDRGDKQKYYDGPVPKDFVLSPGSLLVAMTEQAEGLLGSSALVPSEGKPCLHNQRLGLVRPLPSADVDVRFLYYLFNTSDVRRQIRATASGAKVRHTAPSRIVAVVAYVPELPVQRRIASILGAYDDLIEVNRRRIAVLEEMARRLFGEFVTGRIGHLPHPSGAQAQTIALPGGWRITPLSDFADLVMGQSPPSAELNTDGRGLPFHQGVTDFGPLFPTRRVYCDSLAGKRIAEDGDILFSVRAPVGRINVATERVVLGRGVAAIRAQPTMRSFLLAHLRTTFHSPDMIGNGAIYKAVNRADIERVPIVQPPSEVVGQMEPRLGTLRDWLLNLYRANAALAMSRDLLLPRLISGDLPVTAAERELEAVA